MKWGLIVIRGESSKTVFGSVACWLTRSRKLHQHELSSYFIPIQLLFWGLRAVQVCNLLNAHIWRMERTDPRTYGRNFPASLTCTLCHYPSFFFFFIVKMLCIIKNNFNSIFTYIYFFKNVSYIVYN